MNQVVDKALRGMALLKVSNIRHWTDRTFSFNCERPQGFRFRSGEFVMIGLMVEGKPLVRAYSIASPSWDDELEFYSIKVQDGPLTSRLQHLGAGDEIVMRPKPVGTLVHDALLPGQAAVPLRHRHRHRALRLDHPRPGDLREVRAGGADPHLPGGGGARLTATT